MQILCNNICSEREKTKRRGRGRATLVKKNFALHFNFDPKMRHGTLELLLVSAKGLDETDFLSGMDPYAIITYRTQEKKSGIASGEGSCPEWNESFLFSITSDTTELKIKLMDKDTFTADDLIGEATIPLAPLFDEENIPPMSYHVVKDEKYCGEIRVGLTFTPYRSRAGELEGESLGGWKQSFVE